MSKPKAQTIGLNTLRVHGKIVSAGKRPDKKRVFSDDDWSKLNRMRNDELLRRINQGKHIITLLYRPEMMNMNNKQADMISGNLRFQIDDIWSILAARGVQRPTDGG